MTSVTQISTNINTSEILKSRGIADMAAAAGWCVDGKGWTYPVFDFDRNPLTGRWKRFAGQGAKYFWDPSKGDANYYFGAHPEQFLQSIIDAGGIVWIANGEPSVLAMNTAGIINVFSWFGEGSIPAMLADDLAAWGVTEVRYLADHDETGRKSAANVRDRLAGTGIAFKPLAWGDVADGYDANDLWIDCRFANDVFRARLADLDALILPREERQPEISINWSEAETPADLVSAVRAALGLSASERTNSDGWTKSRIANPIDPHEHDDHNPGCSFNMNTGVLKDFKGRNIGPYELAAYFGIDTIGYRPQGRARREQAIEAQLVETLPDARAVWDALPNVRNPTPSVGTMTSDTHNYMQLFEGEKPAIERPTKFWPDYADGLLEGEIQWSWVLPGEFRSILYTAVQAGIYRAFTADELSKQAVRYGLCISPRTVRNLQDEYGILVDLDTSSKETGLYTKTTKNSRGRPKSRFALPVRQEWHRLIKQYGYSRLLTIAMTDGKDVLPMYAREQLLAALDIEIPNEDDLIAALNTIIEGLKASDPEFKSQIDRAYARFRTWYDQLCHDLDRSEFADDFQIDPDLHHKDTARTVFAAQMARIHRDRRASKNINRYEWCMLTGVSNGSLKKVLTLSGTRRVGGKPPTKTARLDANNPFDAPAAAQKLHKEVGGRPRWIISDGRRTPYNGSNLQNAVLNCEAVFVEYSVAGPWEQFTPTAEEIALVKEPAQSRLTAVDHHQDDDRPRKPRRPHYEGPGVDPYVVRKWFDGLLEASGWHRDEGDYWSDPARVLWPDHLPTLLQALTGVQIPGARGPLDTAQDDPLLHFAIIQLGAQVTQPCEMTLRRKVFA